MVEVVADFVIPWRPSETPRFDGADQLHVSLASIIRAVGQDARQEL